MKYIILIHFFICSILDIKQRAIPGVFIYVGVIIAELIYLVEDGKASSIQNSIFMPCAIFGIFFILSKLEIGIGEADAFFFFMIGLAFGNKIMLESVVVSFFLCGLFATGMILFKRVDRKKEIAFVPFIFLACIAIFCLGSE